MSFDDTVKLIRELGFPAAVAFFVLWRLDGRLGELVKQIEALHQGILQLLNRERPRA